MTSTDPAVRDAAPRPREIGTVLVTGGASGLGAAVVDAVAAAGGTLVGWALPAVQLVAGAVLGVGVGVLVTALHALFDRFPALVRHLPSLAVVVLPVTVSGVLVYVAGRVFAA